MTLSFFTRITIIISCLASLLGLVACNDKRADVFVARMDSLYQVEPQTSIDSIDSFMASDIRISRHNRMTLNLYRMRAQNSSDIPFTSDSLPRLVAEYFNHHGTLDEQMSAYYVLGSAYRDMKNFPEALTNYQKAVALADTTNKSTNFQLLSRIYGQMGDVLYGQLALNEAYSAYQNLSKCALYCGDTLAALIGKEQLSNVLYVQNRKDEAFKIREWLYGEYLRRGYISNAVKSLMPNVYTLINRNQLTKAEWLLEQYEKYSGDVDSLGVVNSHCLVYYEQKGLVCLYNRDIQGALKYFRRGLESAVDNIDREGNYHGMGLLYSKINVPDSAAKYFELAREENDSAYQKMSTSRMQQMQAAYNYSTKEREADEAKNTVKIFLLIIVSAVMLVIVIAVFVVLYMNKRQYKINIERQERLRQIATMLKNDQIRSLKLQQLEQGKQELEMMMSQQQLKISQLIDDKKQLLDRMRCNFSQNTEKTSPSPDDDMNIITSLLKIVDTKPRAVTKEERTLLEDYIAQYHQEVFALQSTLSYNEYSVLMLVKLDFKPSEVSVLTGLSIQNVANIRKRMYEKLTKTKGSSKDFDEYVKRLI